MAIAKFTINLNGGDAISADNDLTYKVYGSADSFTTPIATLGSHNSDANVTVSGGIATLTGVDVGSETTFKVTTVDQSNNESLLSDEYVLVTLTPVLLTSE